LHRANLHPVTPERWKYYEITIAISVKLVDFSITPYGGFGGGRKKSHGDKHSHVQFGMRLDLAIFIQGTKL
jgi:hypothetical protein